jgi:uncharacterized protein DUF3313
MNLARAAVVVLLLGSCAHSYQARNYTPTSFLGDSASLLTKGKRGEEPLLVYKRPNVQWASYDKILIDPIEVWTTERTQSNPDQSADIQKLADIFHQTLTEKLAKFYRIVSSPETGTLRIRAALVDAMPANAAFKVAKTAAPYMAVSVADSAWTFLTGKPAFGGEVSIELMIHDAATGELLYAGADRRVGGDQIGKATFTTWGDVQNIVTLWSDLAAYRLCVARGAKDCQKPSAGLLALP